MIDAGFFAAADLTFESRGLPRASQRIDVEIAWQHWDKEPYWLRDDVFVIPVTASDMVYDLPLDFFAGRQLWISYDCKDKLATQKAADLAAMLRADRQNRPALASFIDRKDHLRQLTPAAGGWVDKTPELRS